VLAVANGAGPACIAGAREPGWPGAGPGTKLVWLNGSVTRGTGGETCAELSIDEGWASSLGMAAIAPYLPFAIPVGVRLSWWEAVILCSEAHAANSRFGANLSTGATNK
jgi:hypothetical protein